MANPAIPTTWMWSDSTYGTIAANVSATATTASIHAVQGTFPTPVSGQSQAYTAVINPNLSGLADNATTERVTVIGATSSGSVQFLNPLINSHSTGENFVLVADSTSLAGISNSAVTQPTQVNPGDSLQYTTASVWDNVPQQFNVKAWGATGNGSTDDTAALQAVINYVQSGAASVYGGTIFFPPGSYKVTSTLTVAGLLGQGIDFVGDGSTKATILSYITGTSGSVAPTPTISWHNALLAANIQGLPTVTGGIRGITIDGLNSVGNVSGFDFGDLVGLSMADLQVQNFYGGTLASGGKPRLSGALTIHSGVATYVDAGATSTDVGKQATIYTTTPNGASVSVQESLGYVTASGSGSVTVSGMPTWSGTSSITVEVDYAYNAIGINMNNQYFIAEESQWWGVYVDNNRLGLHITRTYHQDTGITLTNGATVFADANATTADINKTVVNVSATNYTLPGYVVNVASGSVTMSSAIPSAAAGTNQTIQIGGDNSFDYTKMHDLRVQSNDGQTGILVDNGMFSYGGIFNITGNTGYNNYYTPYFRVTSGNNSTNVTAIKGAACHISVENDSGIANSGIDFQVDNGCSLVLNGNIQTSNFGESLISGTGLFNNTGVIITKYNTQGGTNDSGSTGGILTSSVGVNTTGYISPGNNSLNGVYGNIWNGTGVPSASLGANGDYYFRVDGSTTTHIYFKSSGSWAGII